MRVNPVTALIIKKSYNLVHFNVADASPHPDDVSLLLAVSISTARIVSESRSSSSRSSNLSTDYRRNVLDGYGAASTVGFTTTGEATDFGFTAHSC